MVLISRLNQYLQFLFVAKLRKISDELNTVIFTDEKNHRIIKGLDIFCCFFLQDIL